MLGIGRHRDALGGYPSLLDFLGAPVQNRLGQRTISQGPERHPAAPYGPDRPAPGVLLSRFGPLQIFRERNRRRKFLKGRTKHGTNGHRRSNVPDLHRHFSFPGLRRQEKPIAAFQQFGRNRLLPTDARLGVGRFPLRIRPQARHDLKRFGIGHYRPSGNRFQPGEGIPLHR